MTDLVSRSEIAEARRVCTVIPALNEAASIVSVVKAVYRALPGSIVLVVDDGSSDATAELAAGAGAAVLSLPFNLGIGGAVQAGYKFALRHECSVTVQIDGDGQHNADEVHRIIAPILDGRADMVIGSRWLGRGDYVASRSRRLGMRILSALVHWRVGQTFTDTTSGFRAVNRDVVQLFARAYPTDFPEVESLVLAVEQGLRVCETGVHMAPRQHGSSSLTGFTSPYYMLRIGMALVVGRLGSKH